MQPPAYKHETPFDVLLADKLNGGWSEPPLPPVNRLASVCADVFVPLAEFNDKLLTRNVTLSPKLPTTDITYHPGLESDSWPWPTIAAFAGVLEPPIYASTTVPFGASELFKCTYPLKKNGEPAKAEPANNARTNASTRNFFTIYTPNLKCNYKGKYKNAALELEYHAG